MNRALIVIDMQYDFIDPDVLGGAAAQAVVPEVQKLVDEFRTNGEAIYYTQDTHDEYYLHTQEGQKLPVPHCKLGSEGWRIVNEVDTLSTPHNKIYHLKKTQFAYDDWESEHLDQYDEVIICGLVSSICVISNALVIKMLYPDLPIKFAAYASAGLDEENHAAAINVMRACQIEVVV